MNAVLLLVNNVRPMLDLELDLELDRAKLMEDMEDPKDPDEIAWTVAGKRI